MKIMVVDDSDLMRKEIIRSVTLKEDEVLECSSGESAIQNCVAFNPDWILMDIRMKNMNGIKAAETIKEILPNVNIVFVTGYDNYSYRNAAKSLGFKYYFLKTHLLDIRKVLEQN